MAATNPTLPLKNISEEEINERFENLRNKYIPKFEHQYYSIRNITKDLTPLVFKDDEITGNKSDYWLLIHARENYKTYDLIGDFFTEECRLKAKVDNNLSPEEYFNKNYKEVRNHAKTKYGKITNETVRESLFELSREATSFRPTNLVAIIKLFKSKRILDFSAGWGDRLIAAMSADVELYVGVDPNPCLHPQYKKIIKYFSSEFKINGKYVMIESPFETAEIPEENFDLVFTSPPYFDFEVYTNADGQSIKNRNLDQWFNDFLMFSIKKSINLLIDGGYLVIVINDIFKGHKYVSRMVSETSKLIHYCGIIGYTEKRPDGQYKNPQPMWIFKKL